MLSPAGIARVICWAGSTPPYHDLGFLRVWDISDPRSPQQLSIFHSPHSHPDPQIGPIDSGPYCIHNPVLIGSLAFISWYKDGIRVVDLTQPERPREIGSFVSPGQIWGVHVQPEKDTLVLASDFDFGLYLLRPVRPTVSGVSVEPAGAAPGGTFTATFSGADLSEQAYVLAGEHGLMQVPACSRLRSITPRG